MDQKSLDINQKALILSNQVRDLMGTFISKYLPDVPIPDTVAIIESALATEFARIRHIAVSAGLGEDHCDEVFWSAVMNNYKDILRRQIETH